jgi:hypothetical protein
MVLSGAPDVELGSRASAICSILDPSTYPLCHQIVSLHTPILRRLLADGVRPSSACSALSLCPTTPTATKGTVRPPTEGIGCGICMQIAGYVAELLREGASEADIYTQLTTIYCQTFEFPNSALCTAIADLYLPTMIQDLATGMDEYSTCGNLAFCDANGLRVGDSDDCQLCLLVIEWCEGQVESRLTPLILYYGAELCDLLPGGLADECVVFLYQNIDSLIQAINDAIPSQEICAYFGYCGASGRKTKKAPKTVTDSLVCQLCRDLVGEIGAMATDQKTQEDIELYLQGRCKQLGGVTGSLCKSTVEQYLPMIWVMIEKGMQQFEICTKIRFCGDGMPQFPAKVRMPRIARQ